MVRKAKEKRQEEWLWLKALVKEQEEAMECQWLDDLEAKEKEKENKENEETISK